MLVLRQCWCWCRTAMIVTAALIFLALVAGISAVPFGGDTAVCSTECPIAGSPKQFYQPGKTYTYEYSGKSKIQLEGVEGGLSETYWSAKVELLWITPCDMVITVKDYKTDGVTVPDAASFLERYPLVVAVIDGWVQHVCSHPDDDTWSINLKKGIASAFQNSLPSNSTAYSGHTITETDVVGRCPTKYEVENEGDGVIMRKEKNHRLCKERYYTPAETQVPWTRSPLPLEVSESSCIQEIRNGIFSTITCEDMNVVRPSYGAYKYVEAKQESTLSYLSNSNEQSPADFQVLQSNMVRQSLLYNYDLTKKDPSLVAQLDQIMSQICEKTKDLVDRDVAALVARAVQLLRKVPEEAVEQTLEKIRSSHYCQDYRKLEELFLDAVSFAESGAVKVMVKELVSGQSPNSRVALYTAGLFLLPRPSIHAVMALKPLFETTRPLTMPILAAATMVNTYCRHNRNCHEQVPVRSLVEALGNKLQSECSASDDDLTVKAALTTLKALGNMGVMTQEVATSVLGCMETEEVEKSIRVAAAQAFRQAKCNRTTSEKLVNFAVNPEKPTEVRIAAYLEAVKCAEERDFEEIVFQISKEENTQVRAFILSHLLNLQQSDAPDKLHLRYLLTNIVIPRDFNADIRKYSRNIDLSYFSPSAGVGAGLESNIIYDAGSFVPRSIDFNITAALEGISMNIGEVGARFEGLEPVIEHLFGPKGYIQKASVGQIFSEIAKNVEKNGKKFVEYIQQKFGLKRLADKSVLSRIFHKIFNDGSRVVKADLFARFMGQEIVFTSIHEDLKDISADNLIESLLSYFENIIPEMNNLNINSARSAQMSLEYFLPTIQGTPLKVKMEGTAVAGLKMEGNLNLVDILSKWKKDENIIRVYPSLSVHVDSFVGYDAYLDKTGIKMTTNISSSNGLSLSVVSKDNQELEIQLDLPEKMEIINMKSETYLMKSVRGSPETKIIPTSMRDIRVRSHSCVNSLESVLGLKFCYEMDIPDIFRSSSLPLGAPAVAKLYIEKTESSMMGYHLTTSIQKKKGSKMMVIKVDTPGSSIPREVETYLSHTIEEDSYIMSARIRSSALTSSIWVTLINRDDHKAVTVHARHQSSMTDISRGIKVDIKIKSSTNGKEYNLDIYSSRSRNLHDESKIFESKLVKKANGSEVSLDLLSRTQNALRNYLDFSLAFGADLRYLPHFHLPIPTKLRKIEFHTGLRGWLVSSYIRRTSESDDNVELSSAFKIACRNEDLISVEAAHSTQGRLCSDFISETTAKVKMGRAEYKAASSIHCEYGMKGASLQVIRSDENVKVVDLEAIQACSGQSCNTKVMVFIPEFMRTIKVESRVVEQEQDLYMIQTAVKHGDNILLQTEGSVMATFSSQMTRLQTALKINIFSRTHKIASTFILSENQVLIAFNVKNEQHSIFSGEWSMMTEGRPVRTTITFKFILPVLMDLEIDLIASDRYVRVMANSLLFPRSSSPRRVKSLTSVDLEHRKFNIDVSWDADDNPNMRVAATGYYMTKLADPHHTYIGTIQWMSQIYEVKVNFTALDPFAYFHGNGGLDVEITTTSQKALIFKMKNSAVEKENSCIWETLISYKNLKNEDHIFSSVIAWVKLDTPYNYKVMSELSYTSPEGHMTSVVTEAKHQTSSQERLVYLKSSILTRNTILTRSATKPLEVEFLSYSRDNYYSIIWKADMNTPATMFKWDLETFPEGGVRLFDSALDLSAIRDLLKTALNISGRYEGGYDNLDVLPDRERYLYSYQNLSPRTYSVVFESPTRIVEGEAEYSPSKTGLTIYPNKRKSDAKYEITAKSSHSHWDQQSKYEGRISHPRLSKDLQMEALFSGSGENMRGTIKLDIFPDKADEITGTLQSSKIANNTVQIEASFTTRVLKVSPKVIIIAAYTSHMVGFDMQFRKTPSSPVLFRVSAKYDQIPTGEGTVAFHVVNKEVTVVNIAGVVKPDEEPECDGFTVKAVAHISPIGSYGIDSKLCKPLFIALTINKQGTDKFYTTAKFGFETPNNIETSLSVKAQDNQVPRPIAMMRLRLTSPTLLTIDMAFMKEDFGAMKTAVQEECGKVIKSISNWADGVYTYLKEAAQEQGIHFPDPKILELITEVKNELQDIYQNVMYEGVIPQYKALRDLVAPVVSYVTRYLYSLLVGLADARVNIINALLEEITNLREQLKTFTELCVEG
ncbi:vitellogenin-like isoform X2 [Cherax quadricarinatus]